MKAQRLLEIAEQLISDIKLLPEDEQDVLDEFVGEHVNIDIATERLLKIKDKRDHG